MGADDILCRRLADADWELDGDAEHQLLRGPVNPVSHLAVERRLRAQCLADGANVLGGHADLRPCQCFRLQVSESYQYNLHLLDWSQRHYHPRYSA